MPELEETKIKLQNLVDELASYPHLKSVIFHQQDKIKKHMFVKGYTGSLGVQPCSLGYDIVLCGKDLSDDMYDFMRDLCQSECTGHKQTNRKIGKQDEPFWRVSDFGVVVRAAYHYTGAYHIPTKIRFPDEIDESGKYFEGAVKAVKTNRYERDSKARVKCLVKHGYQCKVCDFDFEAKYGAIGKEYIHVHHIVPLHVINEEYQVYPERHLVPVCPNCHAMLHRPSEVLGIKELRDLIHNESQ